MVFDREYHDKTQREDILMEVDVDMMDIEEDDIPNSPYYKVDIHEKAGCEQLTDFRF